MTDVLTTSSPPRRLRRVGRPEYEIPFRVLALVLIVGAVLVGINLAATLLTRVYGQPAEAHVVSLKQDEIKGQQYYSVNYAFAADGQTITGYGEIKSQRWHALRIGGPIPVKTLAFAGQRWHEISFSAWESIPSQTCLGLLILIVTSSLMVYVACLRPMRYARLISEGASVPGFIIESITSSRNNNERIVIYSYHPPGAEPYRGKTTGPPTLRPVIGQVVTVYYNPRKPWRSVAYEASGFEIIDVAR
jgi:hypothetical protein